MGNEDVEGQLTQLLRTELTFQGAGVIEAGVGTGRVTSLYAEQAQRIYTYDQSAHMLNYARQRFVEQSQCL